jgi:hypothetical protein
VKLTAPGKRIAIEGKDVHKVRIFVEADGNGAVELPNEGPLTIINVPGSALCVLATFKGHGRGFEMRVQASSYLVGTFLSLTA